VAVFVLEMQRAAAAAERTIALLSPDYLKSRFAAPEWAAAFEQDPEGMKRSLIPVRVQMSSKRHSALLAGTDGSRNF
jgi:hypothetical protein